MNIQIEYDLAQRLVNCVKLGYFSNKTNAIREAIKGLVELAEEQKRLIA